jgi:CheY-like chemotaxis protein
MGLGLGLSIARRSGALIGASIEVASRPGRGSRFSLAQPACPPPLAPAQPGIVTEGSVTLARRHDLPLLIVDDDRDVRAALADLLRRWDVPFDDAADSETALALVAGGARYGLILADYRLGRGLNGLDLIAAIVARHGDRPPAAALVTADFDPDLIVAARALGIPVIPKPLRPAQLRALLGVA